MSVKYVQSFFSGPLVVAVLLFPLSRVEAYFGLGDNINDVSNVIPALAINQDWKAFSLLARHVDDAYTQFSTRRTLITTSTISYE